MGSFHVLQGDGSGANYALTVEFHVPVPDEMNLVGKVNLRAALSGDDMDKISSVADGTEQALLATGELLKVVQVHRMNEERPLTERQQSIRERYAALVVEAVQDLRRRYALTGYSESKGVDF